MGAAYTFGGMTPDYPQPTTPRRYLAAPLAIAVALLTSACGTLGYDLEEILASPIYGDFTARTAALPAMPDFGPFAGELDSVRITIDDAGDVSIGTGRWTYDPDTVIIREASRLLEDGEISFDIQYDVRLHVPATPAADGIAATRIESFDEDAGGYVTSGIRESLRAGGRVTEVTDYDIGDDGQRVRSVFSVYTYTETGELATEVVTDYELESQAVADYDSLRYFYDGGALSTYTHYTLEDAEATLIQVDSGSVDISAGAFSQTSLSPVGDGTFEPFVTAFTTPDADVAIGDEAIVRTDDGADARYRAYRYDGGNGYVETYEYYYREALVSGLGELPALGVELTAANPIAAGQAVTFGAIPADATYVVSDVRGRRVFAGPVAPGAAVAWPATAAGTYLLTVEAPGYRPATWRFVAR